MIAIGWSLRFTLPDNSMARLHSVFHQYSLCPSLSHNKHVEHINISRALQEEPDTFIIYINVLLLPLLLLVLLLFLNVQNWQLPVTDIRKWFFIAPRRHQRLHRVSEVFFWQLLRASSLVIWITEEGLAGKWPSLSDSMANNEPTWWW